MSPKEGDINSRISRRPGVGNITLRRFEVYKALKKFFKKTRKKREKKYDTCLLHFHKLVGTTGCNCGLWVPSNH